MIDMTYTIFFLKGCFSYWIAIQMCSPHSCQLFHCGTPKNEYFSEKQNACVSLTERKKPHLISFTEKHFRRSHHDLIHVVAKIIVLYPLITCILFSISCI